MTKHEASDWCRYEADSSVAGRCVIVLYLSIAALGFCASLLEGCHGCGLDVAPHAHDVSPPPCHDDLDAGDVDAGDDAGVPEKPSFTVPRRQSVGWP